MRRRTGGRSAKSTAVAVVQGRRALFAGTVGRRPRVFHTRRMRCAVLSAAVLGGFTACREAVAPWTPPEPPPDASGPTRLTWSAGNDLYPRWAPTGDTVIYAGDGFPGLPIAPGLLLRVPRTGGAAELLIPALQSSVASARRYAQPSVAPSTDRIAFIELAGFRTPANLLNPDTCTVREPLLDSAVIRVRAPIAEASFQAELPLLLAGPDPEQKAQLPGPYDVRSFAFQEAIATSGDLLLRTDWSPDGETVVFSDGLRLHVWTPGEAVPEPIPGTEDGVSPAWSPDGQWIAFTRLSRRADSTRIACNILVGRTVEVQNRWTYSFEPPRLVLIHPDGTGSVDIGPGQDPAWAADGSLFFGNAGRAGPVQRRTSEGALSDVAGTDGGRWPALSPSGDHLAFVRFDPFSGFDVWVTALER